MAEGIIKKPYGNSYPSAAQFLIREGVCSIPIQKERTDIAWAWGLDIIYKLKNMTPANFFKYSDQLLLLAFQEAERYKEYKWRFAGFEVEIGKLKKGKGIPDINTFSAAMHWDSEIMVYGEQALGYQVPQKYFLNQKVKDILDIAKRYEDRVDKQNPYIVREMWISVREPKFVEPGGKDAHKMKEISGGSKE